MTLEQVNKLTEEEVRVKVAELRGWTKCHRSKHDDVLRDAWTPVLFGCPGGDETSTTRLPDYPQDLNAIHEATIWLTWLFMDEFAEFLSLVVGDNGVELTALSVNATAMQRCKAFILTLSDGGAHNE